MKFGPAIMKMTIPYTGTANSSMEVYREWQKTVRAFVGKDFTIDGKKYHVTAGRFSVTGPVEFHAELKEVR